jgi:acetyl-CoA synthetase
MSSTIESVLQETRVFPPSAAFVKQANISGMERTASATPRRRRTSRASGGGSPSEARLAQALHPGARRIQRAVLQVVPRRRAERLVQLPRPAPEGTPVDKTAIIFEADDGKVTKVTYKERCTTRVQDGQRAQGAWRRKGDRVR